MSFFVESTSLNKSWPGSLALRAVVDLLLRRATIGLASIWYVPGPGMSDLTLSSRANLVRLAKDPDPLFESTLPNCTSA